MPYLTGINVSRSSQSSLCTTTNTRYSVTIFKVNSNGEVVREGVGVGSHEHHVLGAIPNPRDFSTLTNEAQVSALLVPDIVAPALAPSTARSYARQWNKFVE